MDLIGKVSGMPSHQSPDHGYSGMVKEPAIYVLTSPATPWVDWPYPGPHHTIDAALDAAGQADALVQYNVYKKVYDSQENVRHAVINALNVAVPQAYRRVAGGGVGVRNYRPTESPMAILTSLLRLYGRLTPTERTGMEARWSTPWNTSYLIETFFDGLEDCFVMTTSTTPPRIVLAI